MNLRPPHPRAFSLVELIVASSIVAILLVAVQSTIMLAAHAVPAANSKATALITAAAALGQLHADAACATAFSARSATAVTFQIPDRTGDGLPETITWAWDGTPRGTLTRQFNSNPAAPVARNVRDFSLAYDTRSAQAPGQNITSAETLFSSATSILPTNQNLDKDHNFGEYIRPSLPANALSWSITRVLIAAATAGPVQGFTNIQIQTADPTNLPAATIIGSASMDETTLGSSASWQTFAFANATGISPQSGACLVAAWVSDAQSAKIQSATVLLASGANTFLKSSDGGKTWSSTSGTTLLHYVYGTYATPGAPVTQYFLTGIRASLLTSADPAARARATLRLVNEPQVSTP